MKKVLFIAPSCIPVTGAEAIVNLKLLKVLSQDEFRIDVVSRLHSNQLYPNIDHKQYGVDLNSLHIIETDRRFSLKTLWLHIKAFFLFGASYRGAHWACIALPTILDLVNKNKYDAVITKDLPGELIGSYLKRKKGLKWLATWNDPYPIQKYPEPYGKGVNAPMPLFAKRLISLMNEADFHIFPSDRLRNYMLQYISISHSNIKVIPHVTFEPHVKILSKDIRLLKMVHSGNLGTLRNPSNFIQAFSQFIKKYPEVTIQLDFIGAANNVIKLSKQYDIEKYINILPPTPYDETQRLLATYHIALIIEAPCAEGIFLPTKVGDAMQNGVDIFAISPAKGVLNDLYKKKHIRYFANGSQVNEIESQLEFIWNDFCLPEKKTLINIPKTYAPTFILHQYKSMIE